MFVKQPHLQIASSTLSDYEIQRFNFSMLTSISTCTALTFHELFVRDITLAFPSFVVHTEVEDDDVTDI